MPPPPSGALNELGDGVLIEEELDMVVHALTNPGQGEGRDRVSKRGAGDVRGMADVVCAQRDWLGEGQGKTSASDHY